jgi:hypothetical protein
MSKRKTKKKEIGKRMFKKKRFGLFFLQQKIINSPLVKEEKALLIITFLIFCLTFITFWEVRRSQVVIKVISPEIMAIDDTDDNIVFQDDKKKNIENKETNWQSFGDNFSSFAYLNSEQTNMYLDDVVTAFMFPPQYSFIKQNCFYPNCGFEKDMKAVYISDGENSVLSDLDIIPQPLPQELRDKEILAVNLNTLNKLQVVSFIVYSNRQEQSFVYFLDKDSYKPIITNETKEKIITKYQKGGGFITVAGDDDDFLILYSGYEGKGYHYKEGKLYDISRFFGLRVVAGGFQSYIIKQGRGNDTLWYVMSISLGKIKMIKLWQNGTSNIKGAYDLSQELLTEISQSSSLLAFRSGDEQGKIEFLLGQNNYNNEFADNLKQDTQLLTFIDQGFDNSQIRQVVSNNINNKNYPIYKAIIKDLGVSLDDESSIDYIQKFPQKNIDIYLGDDRDNFIKINPQETVSFFGDKQTLYWRMVFYPNNNLQYSPWLDYLNDLKYLVSF